ncbi:MAG TPA: rhomboid family intramembrane serine protease [Candidatus Limnocylindrales bacterium]|nr:rhomboid family intramembrane serine protease [Candidatus Limnocylindrales bacterium]
MIDASSILKQAEEAYSRGEYELAAALFGRLLGNADPTLHITGLLGMADAKYRLDDDEGALQGWIVATQGPETPLTWRAWTALAGARVRQGDLPAAARAYREAERRAPEYERPGIQSRLGWLNKEMGNAGAAQRYFGRARGGFAPFATYAILGATLAVSLWTGFTAQGQVLENFLALDKEAVMRGELWRLFTVTLVHGGLLHLLFNLYALYIVGPLVEAMYGRTLFVIFYVLSALGGSIASYLFIPGVSVGASGAIFGLFGLIFVSSYIHRPALGAQARAMTAQIGMLIAINLVIGFGIGSFGSIDNAAHVGGLLSGAWLGLVVAPRGVAALSSFWQKAKNAVTPARQRYASAIAVVGVAALSIVLALALQVTPFWA